MVICSTVRAANYYVSLSGSDTNAGTSTGAPWQTIARVNQQDFNPGDTIHFNGGQTFSGTIDLVASDSGTSASPVTFTSYGTGRATISSGSGRGFYALNVAGFVLQNLIFVGNGASDVNGVEIANSQAGDGKLEYVRLFNVEVSGYGRNGVILLGGTGGGNAGFNDVVFDTVNAHNCTNVYIGNQGSAGIMIKGRYGYNAAPNLPTHTNVEVTRCIARDNPGKSGAPNWTGSGIKMGQTRVGAVRYSVAYNNGANSNAGGNSVGIWAADADQITIEFNESYLNKTGATSDGGGFDFDGGTTNSVMQYNYSHDNHGPGYLLYDYGDPGFQVNWDNVTVRYNISQNDCTKAPATHGGIQIASDAAPLTNLKIYNNVVYTNLATGVALYFSAASSTIASGMSGVVANNILYSANGAYAVDAGSRNPTGLQFRGNNYYAAGTWRLRWNAVTHSTLAAWRTASGQEMLSGNAIGSSVNPLLTSAGTGGTLGGYVPTALTAYKLQATSPMIDAGLNLTTLFGISVGLHDYYRNVIPADSGRSVGAHERPEVAMPLPLVEFRFNETGTMAPSSGADTTAVAIYNGSGVATDLHTASGAGVSGLSGDRALNFTAATGMGSAFTGPYARHLNDNNNIDTLRSFTVTGWFKTASTTPITAYAALVRNEPAANGAGYNVTAHSSNGTMTCNVDNTFAPASPASFGATQQWVFVAATYDGNLTSNNVKYYVGSSSSATSLVATTTLNLGTTDENIDPLFIGNRLGGDRPFDGYLDNIRIYGSKTTAAGVLTQAQLETIRRSDGGAAPAGPITKILKNGLNGYAGSTSFHVRGQAATTWHGPARYYHEANNLVGTNGFVTRTFYKWDVSPAASAIPAGATITNARLRIKLEFRSQAFDYGISCYRMAPTTGFTVNYGAATRDTYNGSTNWSGGLNAAGEPGDTNNDYIDTPVSNLATIPAVGAWMEFDVTSAVQAWVSGTPNQGFLIKTNPGASNISIRLSTPQDSHGSVEYPELEVTYN